MLFYDDGDSALRYTLWNPSSIRGFQIVFEYGIRYYPTKRKELIYYSRKEFSADMMMMMMIQPSNVLVINLDARK
jgi:hypothetical protein